MARTPQRTEPSQATNAIRDWLLFTLAKDTIRTVFRVPHILINWLVIIGLAGIWWFQWRNWWPVLAAVTGVVIIYSIGRAARHLKAQRKTLAAIYEQTRRVCKHPNSTLTRPVDPASLVKVRRWLRPPGQPQLGSVAVNPDSSAASFAGRTLAERSIERSLGETVPCVFTHQPGSIVFEVVKPDDPRIQQRKTRQWFEQTLLSLFPKAGPEFEVSCDWPDDGGSTPARVEVMFGAGIAADRAFRANAERSFDERCSRAGVEWVYDWSAPGIVTITAVDPADGEAVRKRSARKIADVATTLLGQVVRGAASQADVQVTRWVEDGKPAAHTPIVILIGFGTADFSPIDRRLLLEDRLDEALATEWPDRIFLPNWQFGHSGQLTLTAVPKGHREAKRRDALKNLRQIVRSSPTFEKIRSVDVTVNDWLTDEDGGETAASFVIRYGTADMTDAGRRLTFETHLDSKTRNDWSFDWTGVHGELHAINVPPLPTYSPFPEQGTPEYDEWHEEFRSGRVILGPAKGGGRAMVNFDTSPHVLIGGQTGAGKSQALGLFIYGVLMNPGHAEMTMVDFKVTDWSWVAGYPNVAIYAPTNARQPFEEIAAAVAHVYETMNARQMLLAKYQVRSMRELRRAIKEGRVTDITLDDVPRRHFLVFDESGAAFDQSKDPDARALQDAIRGDLGKIVMLGRAMEVHVVTAAQKPAATNLGTQVMNQLVNKIGIGRVDPYTSQQIFAGLDIGTKIPEGAPKGFGWFVNDAGARMQFQSLYLPNDDQPDFADPSVRLRGIITQVADMLIATGWQSVQEPRTIVAPDPQGNMVESIILVARWNRPGSAPAPTVAATRPTPRGDTPPPSSPTSPVPAPGKPDEPKGPWGDWSISLRDPKPDTPAEPGRTARPWDRGTSPSRDMPTSPSTPPEPTRPARPF